MSSKRPTQADVAKLAGVSRGTVSMVLNGRTYGKVPISDETRDRVLEAATKLGYAPNPVAQMLAKGQNFLIGVFVYDDKFPSRKEDYFFPYLTGVQNSAIENDYNVLLFTRNHNADFPTVYENDMNTLRLADGCIFMGADANRPELARLHEENYPFVYIGRREVPDCEINWVINDYTTGAAEATRHLLCLGHRNLAFLSTRLGNEAQIDKYKGCEAAVDEEADASLELLLGEAFATKELLLQSIEAHQLTALVVEQDVNFHRVLQMLAETSLRVPDDISILSLTTAEHSLPYTLKPTHLNLNRGKVGAKAVEVLIDILNGEVETPQQVLLKTEFEIGETTGRCPN